MGDQGQAPAEELATDVPAGVADYGHGDDDGAASVAALPSDEETVDANESGIGTDVAPAGERVLIHGAGSGEAEVRRGSDSPPPEVSAAGDAAVWAHLARIRACESGGRYAINTGNGHFGAYQFTLGTWAAMGGAGLPSDASPEEQDYRAYLLYTRYGPQHWPVCQYR